MKFDPVLFAKAIADEIRRKVMSECCCCWLSVNEIVEKLGFHNPFSIMISPFCTLQIW